jgi:hypothetical protein
VLLLFLPLFGFGAIAEERRTLSSSSFFKGKFILSLSLRFIGLHSGTRPDMCRMLESGEMVVWTWVGKGALHNFDRSLGMIARHD